LDKGRPLTVDPPVGKRRGVQLFVKEGARVLAARQCAGITVDAELEAQRVDFGGQPRYAAGELDRVRVEAPGLVVARLLEAAPAVVDVDVLVAGVFEAEVGELLSHLEKEVLADVARVLVPRVPPERREAAGAVGADERVRERQDGGGGGGDGRHGEGVHGEASGE
jgi:hypothetical protein